MALINDAASDGEAMRAPVATAVALNAESEPRVGFVEGFIEDCHFDMEPNDPMAEDFVASEHL